ncbi:MAG TPA: hypothetical protein VFX87_10330 [Methylomirabilota bacterium]|nr:hypothetical protein [Methylomirabilota bacterium]
MKASRLLLGILLVYVFLDFANPFIDGAFCFDASDSLEALSQARARLAAPAAERSSGLPVPVLSLLAAPRGSTVVVRAASPRISRSPLIPVARAAIERGDGADPH